jgi:hypothetical protein
LDRHLADGIAQIIRQCIESPSFVFEVEEVLEPGDRPADGEGEDSKGRELDLLTEKQLEEALPYYRSTASGTRTVSSMHSRYRYITGEHHIRQLLK